MATPHDCRRRVLQPGERSCPTLIARTLAATTIIVGIWFVAFPYFLVSNGVDPLPLQLGNLRFLGIVPLGFGAGVFGLVTWTFASVGGGTPLVFDAPTRFVVAGLNRWVRNPMYVGDVLILLGEAILFESSGILVYAATLAVGLHVVVVRLEEPRLQRRFGRSYEAYCHYVPRWVPRSPWAPHPREES